MKIEDICTLTRRESGNLCRKGPNRPSLSIDDQFPGQSTICNIFREAFTFLIWKQFCAFWVYLGGLGCYKHNCVPFFHQKYISKNPKNETGYHHRIRH